MKEQYFDLISKIKDLSNSTIQENKDETDYYFSINSENGHCYWISFSKKGDEIIAGIDLVHEHFDNQLNKLQDGIPFFKNLLSSEIMITKYFSGDNNYKNEYELLLNNETNKLGSASIFYYTFWKKNIIKKEKISAVINQNCW